MSKYCHCGHLLPCPVHGDIGKPMSEQKRLDRPDKKVCKCPACPDGSVYLIKLGEFDYKFQCDNNKCQTRRRRWSDG